MSDKHSHDRLDGLRERLYARGEEPREHKRSALSANGDIVPKQELGITPPPPRVNVPPPPPSPAPERPRRIKRYRGILLLIAVAFFVLSVLASSLYIMLGRNTVSGNNISLDVTGPFTVGGGEVLYLQIGVTNQNTVPIQSATLVVEYPSGTLSAEEGEELKELYTERIDLPSINAGETYNMPLKARVFGEENQEAIIKTAIEYRISGSSATFHKDADEFRFKIGSAPLVFDIDAEETISSGQETTIGLTINSNSPTTLENLVVMADYPSGFDFTEAEPAPISGRNVWHIDQIESEGSVTIDISGILNGTESEERVVNFTVGVASDSNPNKISSVLAKAATEFTIEEPFLSFEVKVGNSTKSSVSIPSGSQTTVAIDMENTSSDNVYDGVVEVQLGGNALSQTEISVSDGYYDSNTRTIIYDVSTADELKKLEPGQKTHFSFSVKPSGAGLQTPQVTLAVRATGRRVSQSNAREEISGTIDRTIKVESTLAMAGSVADVTFGPVPPVVGKATMYRVVWQVNNGGNGLNNAVVTATLPSYVDWTGNTAGAGNWDYNDSTHTITWSIGNIPAAGTQSGSFGVSFLPSSSQIGRTPTLVNGASLSATDNFTGSALKASTQELTTELAGQKGSGEVTAN